MTTQRHTIAEFAAAGARHIAGAAAGLLTVPLVAYRLGTEALGGWALLGTASFLLSVSDVGLSVAVQRAAVKDDPEPARRAIGLAVLVILIVGPALGLALWALLLDVPGASRAIQTDLTRAGSIAMVAGVVGALAFPYRGFVLAKGGMRSLAWIRSLASLLQVGITWIGLQHWASLMVPAAGLLVAQFAETGLTLWASQGIDPKVPLGPRVPESLATLKAALVDGAAACTVSVASMLALRVDVFILSQVAPLAIVAAYGVATRAVDQSFTLAKQVSAALLPRLGRPEQREDASRLGTMVLGGLAAAGMTALALNGRGLLVAWAGEAAAIEQAAVAMALLASAAIIASGYEVVSSALMLGGRTAWASAGPIVVGNGINVAISWSLAARFGVWAVAGGTLVGSAITFVLMWRNALDLLQWRLSDAFRSLAPLLAASVAGLVVAWPLRHLGATDLRASLAACALSTIAGLAAAATVACLLWPSSSRALTGPGGVPQSVGPGVQPGT